jgi:hypothetical protein
MDAIQNFMKSAGLLSVVAMLSACGGGGDPIIVEPFSLVDESGAVTVLRLDSGTLAATEVDGEWNGGDQALTVSGQELAALSSSVINDSSTFVRQVSGGTAGESLVYSATNAGNLPSGTADYAGTASVVIADGATTSSSYSLTGDGVASVNFESATLGFTISGLTGSRTTSAAGPQDFTSDGPITIANLVVSSDGSIGAGD